MGTACTGPLFMPAARHAPDDLMKCLSVLERQIESRLRIASLAKDEVAVAFWMQAQRDIVPIGDMPFNEFAERLQHEIKAPCLLSPLTFI